MTFQPCIAPALALVLPAAAAGQIVINEIRIDDPSADDFEYAELFNAGGETVDLEPLTYLVIGDGPGGSGVIEAVVDLPPVSVGPGERYLISDVALVATGTPLQLEIDHDWDAVVDIVGVPDLDHLLNFGNGDNVTHLLVTGFTGALDDDLDTDDDGALDITPWTGVVDAVGLVETPGVGDRFYGTWLGFADVGPEMTPDGEFVPAHVFRSPDGGPWSIGHFGSETNPVNPPVKPNVLRGNFENEVQDTPGSANLALKPLAVTLSTSSVLENASPLPARPTALTGTVSRTGISGDVLINLRVDDETEADVDLSVFIFDGFTESDPFKVVAVNDAFPDGAQTVTVTATAGGFTATTAVFDVVDDGDEFSLVVNEAYYLVDPAHGDANGDGFTHGGYPSEEQFIEIVNAAASPLELSGHTVFVDRNIVHEFREGTILDPACALVIFGGRGVEEGQTAAFGSAQVQRARIVGNPFLDGLFLANAGSEIVIRDDRGVDLFCLQLPDQTSSPAGGSSNLATDGDPVSGYVLHTTLTPNPWSPGTTAAATAYCAVPNSVTVSLDPAVVAEDAPPGSATATISLGAPVPAGGQTFTVVTNNATELVPATPLAFVTGGSSVLGGIALNPVNDLHADGVQMVTVTVIGSNFLNGSATLGVRDDGDTPLDEDLFLSEYSEGSGVNRYLEVFNPTILPVSLDGYLLGYVFDEPATPGEPEGFVTFTTGALIPPGGTWVISHPSANPAIRADQTDSNVNFDGNDAFALLKGTTGDFVVLDTIGDFDRDPDDGVGWAVADVPAATIGHTLVRKNFIAAGNPDWTASRGTNGYDSEWIVLGLDNTSSLGRHPNPPVIRAATRPDAASLRLAFSGTPATVHTLETSPDLQAAFDTAGVTITGGSMTPDVTGTGTVDVEANAGGGFYRITE